MKNSLRVVSILKNVFFLLVFPILSLSSAPSVAEEGGAGHYLPGSMASFMDGVAAEPTFLVRYNLLNYSGSFETGKPIPIGGITAINVNANTWAHGLTVFWAPKIDLGDKWTYGMSATVPYVIMEVTADVEPEIGRTDNASGLGDIVFQPIMFNYHASSDLNFNARLSFYAPTGDYEVGRLANPGRNYWSVEPMVAMMYFGQQNGREVSWFAGLSMNEKNPATEYKSGNQFHSDMTTAQHFPLAKGLAGVGLNGFYYQQITGDSGPGANFGDFKGQTYGLGPVISYVRPLKNVELLAELKWLHEFGTNNRLEGDYVWLKIICKF